MLPIPNRPGSIFLSKRKWLRHNNHTTVRPTIFIHLYSVHNVCSISKVRENYRNDPPPQMMANHSQNTISSM